MSDPARLPAVELARLVRAGSLSPLDSVDAVLRRIQRLEPQLNACITVTGDEARAAARAQGEALAAGRSPGPLAGVTVTIKDLLNTAGVATTFGSHGFADNVPAADCIAAARLKAAGAILVAKTTTPEFGHKPFTEAPLFGRTANPWDPARTPGGSGGGAGAAGAVGYGALHVGTDGGGSTRIPAAACGLVGFKASLGRVPHDQAPDSFANLSYIGPMTRTVADAAAMMDVIAGPDPRDVYSLGHGPCDFAAAARAEGDLAGLRIGCRLRLGNDLVEAETERLFTAAWNAFAEGGATLVAHEDPFEGSLATWAPLTFSARAARFGDLADRLGNRMTPSLAGWIAEGRGASAVEVQRAMQARTATFRQVQSWFDDIDLLVTPTLSRPALDIDHDVHDPVLIDGVPAGGIRDAWYPYTHPFNMTGHPAITLPCGWTGDGLPVALQIVGPWGADGAVFRAAAHFEAARPWAERLPDLG